MGLPALLGNTRSWQRFGLNIPLRMPINFNKVFSGCWIRLSSKLHLGTFLFQAFRLGAERLGPRTVGLRPKLNDGRSIVGRFSNGGSRVRN